MSIYFIPLLSLLLCISSLSCDQPTIFEEAEIKTSAEGNNTEENTTSDDPESNSITSTNRSKVREWYWEDVNIPPYTWEEGTKFGDGLFVDNAFDSEGVTIVGNQLRFWIDPLNAPADAPSDFNFRSEIHTDPWPIKHPLGTEQWMGWTYTFGDNYLPDPTSPITIFQNHPSIHGLSPQLELELAALNSPSPAKGGELQVVNEASSDRIIYPIKPKAGDELDIVIHVIYGIGEQGLFQVWLNDTLYYNRKTSTVYEEYPWGGNNKWGVYHHTFNDSEADVQSSLDIGAGKMELFMSALRLLTRQPTHPEYGQDAMHLVRPTH